MCGHYYPQLYYVVGSLTLIILVYLTLTESRHVFVTVRGHRKRKEANRRIGLPEEPNASACRTDG